MAMLGMALTAIGALAAFVFGIQLLIAAFRASVGWGIACLLLGFPIFIFVAKNWAETKTPFLRWLMATVVVMIGATLSAFGAVSSAAV